MLQCRGMGTYSQMFSLNEILRVVQASRKKIREGVQNLGEERQINDAIRNYEDVDSWKTVIFLYYISRDLRECAQMVSELDDKMLSLNEAIQACLEEQNGIDYVEERNRMSSVANGLIGGSYIKK